MNVQDRLDRHFSRQPDVAQAAFVAPNATVIGDVHLGENASVWWNAVIRGDTDRIAVGAGSNIQDGSVLHTDAGIPMAIGAGVTVGHMVMIHGATIGDRCLIGIGSIILNRAVLVENTLVGANTLIPEGKSFPPGVLIGKVKEFIRRPLDGQAIVEPAVHLASTEDVFVLVGKK